MPDGHSLCTRLQKSVPALSLLWAHCILSEEFILIPVYTTQS